jgi:hypothetical protein
MVKKLRVGYFMDLFKKDFYVLKTDDEKLEIVIKNDGKGHLMLIFMWN